MSIYQKLIRKILHPAPNLKFPETMDKQNYSVYQPIVFISFLYQFVHTCRLHRADNIYKRMLYMNRYRDATSWNIQWFSAKGCQ